MADIKKWEDYDKIIAPNGEIIDMNKLIEDLERSKAALVHLCPMFGDFISRLKIVYTFHIKTQATDGNLYLINPQFTQNLSFTEKVFVMAHEYMHCLLNHMRRAKNLGVTPQMANGAADYECNVTLAKGVPHGLGIVGIPVMTKLGALIDKKYDGWGFERIYKDVGPIKDESQENEQKPEPIIIKQKADADYIKGWNQAMEDYKNGKIKF